MATSSQLSGKPERKIAERTRRLHMKSLCMKLASLIPKQSRFRVSVGGEEINEKVLQVWNPVQARSVYIKEKQKRIEGLVAKRDLALRNNDMSCRMVTDSTLPVVEVRELDSILEVVLINELHSKFIMGEVVRVLDEEESEIVHAHSTLASDKIFLAIHAQAILPRLGSESATVHRKLKQLLY